MKEYILDLDKPRKLHYGFKALGLVRQKYGEKRDLTDVMDVNLDEMPFFAYVGLVRGDKTLTPERVEDLIDDAIPEKYTVTDIIKIIAEAITSHIGVKTTKKKVKKKTPIETTVKQRS